VGQHLQRAGGDELSWEGHDKGFAAEGVDVGRDGTQPVDEFDRVFHAPHYNSLRGFRSKTM
jgi:hypothetical protein